MVKYIETEKEKGIKQILKEDLQKYFEETSHSINPSTIRSRIHELKKIGIISKTTDGIYSLEIKKEYIPPYSQTVEKIIKKLKKEFPYLNKYSIWNTIQLNEFTELQSNKEIILLEVERGTEEAIFYNFSESYNNIYLKPTKKEIENYILGKEKSIIIKPLISNSPLIKKDGINYPKIEKILVDIYCNKNLFISFQGRQYKELFITANNKYSINRKTLFAYSKRRKREEKLQKYLKNNGIIDLLNWEKND